MAVVNLGRICFAHIDFYNFLYHSDTMNALQHKIKVDCIGRALLLHSMKPDQLYAEMLIISASPLAHVDDDL